MPLARYLRPTPEKLKALASSLSGDDAGQVAVAADLLARLSETPECARLLCVHERGEVLLKTCLDLAVDASVAGDTRADVLMVLKHCLAVPEGRALLCKDALLRPILEVPPADVFYPQPEECDGGGGSASSRAGAVTGGRGGSPPGYVAVASAADAADEAEEAGQENGEEEDEDDEIGSGPRCRFGRRGSGQSGDEAGELATVVRQAWLGLALTAVISTEGGVLDGPQDLVCLQSAVLDLCDRTRDSQARSEGLLLLRHLYEKCSSGVDQLSTGADEAARLASLLRWGLTEVSLELEEVAEEFCAALGDSIDLPEKEKGSAGGSCGGLEDTSADGASPSEAASNALRLLACIGQIPVFRAALFQVEDEELEADQLRTESVQSIEATVSCLFRAMRSVASMDIGQAWRAMTAVAEVKSVRRLMRVHPEMRGLFGCLLEALGSADRGLTEHLVSFLKQIFTGATDQFMSTEPTMFDNMGRNEGLKKLLSALLQSWRDSMDIAHRGNIVAFLADAMFFSSFTDAWQVHPQARDLISILFDALLWKGVEGTAGLALGNFVSANGHIDLILDHERASHSISNVGWFLKRTLPGWDTKMQIYYLWRVLRSRKGCKLLSRHPHSDLVVAGLLVGVRHATMEDNEVLSLLECFLNDDDTRPVVLRGANPGQLLESITEVLSCGERDLCEPSCMLLQALLEATGPGALLTWSGASRLIGVLSRKKHGKEIVDSVVPLLQWEPTLTSALGLEYKRLWVSDQIRSGGAGEAVEISVKRQELLRGVLESLRDPQGLSQGVRVKFVGDETGAGDGHRRECFRIVISTLCDLEFGLFKSMDGGRTLHPSSTAAEAEPEHLTYFELVGKLIALSLLHRETLPAARFTLALRKMLLNAGPLTVEDMATVDPEFYKHKVKYLLESRYAEGDAPLAVADLDLTFEDVPQPDVFPQARHELHPGGSQVSVTEENKQHYVELLCDTRMRGAVSQQVGAMLQGLRSIVPEDTWNMIQRIVSPEELDLLICGLQEVDLADWKACSGTDVDEETSDMFWRVVEGFSQQECKALLEFTTGSPAPPVGGFAQLPGYGSIGQVSKFTLARNLNSALPVAATCFNTLYLPKYTTDEEMATGLAEAIANGSAGGFYEAAVPNG